MKLEVLPTWIAITGIFASALVLMLTNRWHHIALAAFSVDLLVQELEQKVQVLSKKQIDLNCWDPISSSDVPREWLKSVQALQEEEKNIKDRLAECGVLSYFKKFYIGKKVDMELKKAKDLINQGDRLLKSAEASPPHLGDVLSQQLQDPLLGMEVSYAKILDFIKDRDVESELLGIWGMGGVGKTTLMKWVRDSCSMYDNCFPAILFVHAAKGFATVADLQKAIFISMDLAQIGDQTSLSKIIHNYLKDKSFLLLVDDLWEDLDLHEVGIPSLQPDRVQTHRRKVMFTTRSIDVCNRMGCSSGDAIQIKCLNKEDARSLFAQHLQPTTFDHPETHEFAEEIVEECNGLPIALCSIGKLMSNKKDPSQWIIARDLFKKSKLNEITDTHEGLFKRLQENYDDLGMEASYAKVLAFVKDKDVGSVLLGIWGMKGVGKTALIERVRDSRLDQYLTSFSVVLFVHAAMGFTTVAGLQKVISSGLELAQVGNELSQSEAIHNYLQDKSFLLLVDDLREYLDLEKTGIPSLQPDPVQTHKRKVVFTTRSMDVCSRMGCSLEDTIQMKCLNKEDAGRTFAQNVGEKIVDAKRINELAEKKEEEKKIKDEYSRSNIKRSYISNEVAELNKAHDLIGQVGRLMAKIKARLGPIGDVQPEELSRELPGMEGSYVKVLHLIESKSAHPVLMGIWGMPGVGKTTLLRLVTDFYTDNTCFDCSFDHIMFVRAGTECVVNNVQHAISINLGLDWKMMSSIDEVSRARHIFNYLKNKTFLLLLDDVRKPLDLRDVGVPISSHMQQKIILATPSKAICDLMGCHPFNTIEMLPLQNDDAWKLFEGKVGSGIINDDHEVHLLAQQMVSQCGGLPIALSSLGRAMSNKRDPREWRSAYGQLKAIGLEPRAIHEKVTMLLDPPYGWRGRKQGLAEVMTARVKEHRSAPGRKQATATSLEAKSSGRHISPSPRQSPPGRKQATLPSLEAKSSSRHISPSPRRSPPRRKHATPLSLESKSSGKRTDPSPRRSPPGRKQATPPSLESKSSGKRTDPSPRRSPPGRKQATPPSLEVKSSGKRTDPSPRRSPPGRKQVTLPSLEAKSSSRHISPSPRRSSPGRKQATPPSLEAKSSRKHISPSPRQGPPGQKHATPPSLEAKSSGRHISSSSRRSPPGRNIFPLPQGEGPPP